MFVAHAKRLGTRVDTIRRAVQSSDMVRSLLAEPAFDPKGMPEVNGTNSGQWLKKYAPQTVDWKEFDHNSAVTALYAAYECCVTDLLREWVTVVMPIRWPDYHTHLPKEIQRCYIEGVAKLLPKIGRSDRNRYQQLDLKVVARDFADATNGIKPYRLHPDAFFTADQNLRRERLSILFTSVGLTNIWDWISAHPQMIDYQTEVIGEGNTLEQELSKFVQARNDAAHGASTGTYPGTTELNQFATLAERLGNVLIEKARHEMLTHYLTINRAECLGFVENVYATPKAIAVQATTACEVAVGMQFALLTETCCPMDEVASFQIEGTDHQSYVAKVDEILGMKLKSLPKKGTRLVRVPPVAAAVANSSADPSGVAPGAG